MLRSPRRALRALLATSLALTVGVGALAGGAPPAAAAAAARLDLVLLLDGSGSIDDADWDLQLQGYAAALRERTNFPVDGSVAVAVIQWSHLSSRSQNTRLEVPLTVLDSPAAVDEVTAAVLAIEQMGDNTNPGDAVLSGAVELSQRGRPGADGVLCMSTDGEENGGLGLAGAVATARRDGVVDRYSVVAIEDGSFTEARARRAYGPHVFGGGQVTVARTTAEFTTLIAGCAADPLRLVALEVTQGLQDPDNTIPVVTTRDTLVRAYLATYGAAPVRATARLHVTRNGAPIPGSPFTPVFPYSPTPLTGVLVDDGPMYKDQNALDQTLNFRIPAAQATGTWDLRLEYPGGLGCDDQAQNPTCSERVTFTDGIELDLVTVGIGTGAAGSTRLSQAALAEQAARVKAMLPISSFTTSQQWLQVRRLPRGTGDFRSLNSSIDAARLLDGAASDQRRYGVVPGVMPTTLGGLNSGYVASGYEGGASGERDMGWYRTVAVHEVMHSLGVHHTVSAAENGYDSFPGLWRYKKGWCTEVASTEAVDWPYVNTGTGRPAIGPFDFQGYPGTRVMGTDVRFADTRFPLAVLHPASTVPVMSYCPPQDTTTHPKWIGIPDWNQLLTDDDLLPINVHPAPTPAPGPTPGPTPVPTPVLIRAVLDADGAATLLPALPLEQGLTADDPAGTHAVVMLDADGAQVHAVRFTPVESHADMLPGARAELPGSSASVVLPAPEGVASIELRAGDDVLASVPVSASAPEVTVDVPTTGDRDRVTFTWDATDADGDALAHAVRYSADDGASWTTVGIDLEGSSASVPRWALAGSDAARIQVIASDGVNTGVATSAAFPMPNLAPEVAVATPADGTVVSGAQTVVFTASAFDAEDGDLSGDLVWTSDLDGRLGAGATLTRRADELAEGTHVVTVTSTDAAGATSSATLRLVVHRIAPEVLEPPVEEPPVEEPPASPDPVETDPAGAPHDAADAAPTRPTAPTSARADAAASTGLAWTGWDALTWALAAVAALALGALGVWGRSRLRRSARGAQG